MTKDEAQAALDLIQEFKRRWMALPPFAERITRPVREGMTMAHMPIMQLEQQLLTALDAHGVLGTHGQTFSSPDADDGKTTP